VCVVVGSFLPWLHSGTRSRNSYATDGAVRRLLGVSRPGDWALVAWPYVGLACGAAIAALLIGLPRVAAGIGLVAAAGAAVAAITMLTADRAATIRPAFAGPIVTLVGSLVVVVAITIYVLSSIRTNRRRW
jgi:hypothetical protein